MARRVTIQLIQELPQLMVPPLHQSLHHHLISAEPLVKQHEFDEARKATLEFGRRGGVGEHLQQILERSIQNDDLWISENLWQDAFLKSRRPFLYHSAGAICQRQSFQGDEDQLKFAAALTAGVLDFKHRVDSETLSPDILKGKLQCMKQYESLFGTCRIPGITTDTKVQTQSRHIVVASNNHFYKMKVLDDDGVAFPVEALYNHLQYIDQATRVPGVPVGLLTTDNRTSWARVYDTMKTIPENQNTLDSISSAIFLLCIDSASIINAASHPGQNALLGGGSAYNSGNRWFYKMTQLFVGRDGQVGAVFDHSQSDGTVRGRMLDHVVGYAKNHSSFNTSRKLCMVDSERPTKLSFQFDPELDTAIASAGQQLDRYCQDVQFALVDFENFGKHYLKSNDISADSFFQMAIQLTNFRLFGSVVPSRETVSMREFRYGRTDYVRVPSDASDKFVRSMDASDDATITPSQRSLQYLTNVMEVHKQSVKWVMAGNGVDTHLRGLKHIAESNGDAIPAFFQDPTYLKMQQNKIISAQVAGASKHICVSFVLPKFDDSYSIYYNIRGDSLIFIVSAFRNSSNLYPEMYAAELKRSLLDMQKLILQD